MNLWCFLVISVVSAAEAVIGNDEPISFFSERLTLEGRGSPRAADLSGRYLSDSKKIETAGLYDVSLLEECGNLNLYLAGIDKDTANKNTIKKKMQKFVKKLKSRDLRSVNFALTLNHFHCKHALKSVGFDNLGDEFITKLAMEQAVVMKNHLELFGQLSDYSFLTMELVEALYVENQLIRPFASRALVETVKMDVLVRLLEMWEYNLNVEDAADVLQVWGSEEEFCKLIRKDPRSWLLYKTVYIVPPFLFPMDLLIEKLDESTLDTYSNLILAFIMYSETAVSYSMHQLEIIYASFHKNDLIEEQYMTPEIVAALDSRKWDLWFEAGKFAIAMFRTQMEFKRKLIDKLESLKSFGNGQKVLRVETQVIIYGLLPLLQVPLFVFSRDTFMKSQNHSDLLCARDEYFESAGYYSVYSPFIRPEMLGNRNYWTVLWKQLEILDIELAYSEDVVTRFPENVDLLQLITALCQKSRIAHRSRSLFWHTQIVLSMLTDSRDNPKDSTMLLSTIYGLVKDQTIQLSPHQLSQLKMNLNPEALIKFMPFLECQDEKLVKFRLAPEMLTREEIGEMIKDPQMKEWMLDFKSNVARLCWLDAFSVDDLIAFFPLSLDYHLDNCEALYTVNPCALAGYLNASQVAINYPDQLICWIHPGSWSNTRLVDVIADLVPFSVFVKFPKDADALNLAHFVPDIMARIERRDLNNSSPQSMILKWLLHMEWLFLQIHEILLQDTNVLTSPWTKIANHLISVEKRARAQLITWLQANGTLEDSNLLLGLVEKGPLSYARSSLCYDILMQDTLLSIQTTVGPPCTIFKGIYSQFTLFTTKKFLKIRQTDLESAVKEAGETCRVLMKKHLGI